MKAFWNVFKSNLSTIALSIVELLVGILLFIRPLGFTSLIITLAGALLCLSGLTLIIKYFRTEAAAAAKEQNLARGLLSVVAGTFAIFKSAWIIDAFPLLTVLYGAILLFMGVYKLQHTVDMLRSKRKDWIWTGIGAVLALAFAALIFFNPFSTTAVLWTFIAVSLCAEAVTDVLYLIFHIKQSKAA